MIQFLHSSKLVYSSSQHRLAQHFPPLSSLSHLNSQLYFFWSFQSSFRWMWSLFTLSQLSTSSFFNARSWLSLFSACERKDEDGDSPTRENSDGMSDTQLFFFSVPLKNFHSGISFTGCDDLCIFFYLHSSMWALLVLVHEFLTRQTHSTPIRPRSDHDSFICHNFELFSSHTRTFPLLRDNRKMIFTIFQLSPTHNRRMFMN